MCVNTRQMANMEMEMEMETEMEMKMEMKMDMSMSSYILGECGTDGLTKNPQWSEAPFPRLCR